MVPLIACLFLVEPPPQQKKQNSEFCRTPVVQQWWHADWFWISSPKDWRCQWTQDTNGGDGSLGYSPPNGCRYNVRPLEEGWSLLGDCGWRSRTNINLEMFFDCVTKGWMYEAHVYKTSIDHFAWLSSLTWFVLNTTSIVGCWILSQIDGRSERQTWSGQISKLTFGEGWLWRLEGQGAALWLSYVRDGGNAVISMAVAGFWYQQLPDTYPLVKHSQPMEVPVVDVFPPGKGWKRTFHVSSREGIIYIYILYTI